LGKITVKRTIQKNPACAEILFPAGRVHPRLPPKTTQKAHLAVYLRQEDKYMSVFKEKITLANAVDISNARNGLIPDTKIRKITIEAMPDTGAWTLVINEETRQKLGLAIEETSESTLADGKTDTYDVTEGVKIQWKNRSIILPAIVVPNAKDILLGALPLEAMDLMVDPVRERLVGVHGDQPLHVLYAVAG
jgi:clan AA aspartic protease